VSLKAGGHDQPAQAQRKKIMSRIFISGSTTGLGLMAGELLASQSHRVVLHARNADRAEDARRALPKAEAVLVGDVETIAGAKDIASQANALASALESGLLGPSPYAVSLQSVLGYREDVGGLVAALLELAQLGVMGPAAAVWLRTIARASARMPKPDLVWSGPEVPGLHARDTRRVYEQLLGCANARSGQAHMPSSTGQRHLRFLLDEWTRDLHYASRCY
jgi:hypothetical protein